MRDLEPNDIDKLVSIKGVVIRNSEMIPQMMQASFKCHVCNLIEARGIDRQRIDEP